MMRGSTALAVLLLFAATAHAQTPAIPAPSAPAQSPRLIAYETAEENGVAAIQKPLTDAPGDPKAGAKVLVNRRQGNCLGCHEVSALKGEEFHGELGPPLDGVASRWSSAQLRMIVVNPKKVFTADTVMPAFYRVDGLHRVRPEFEGKPILTAQQIEDVVAYLATLK